ncbi:MAG: hypothetical protein HY051_06430 [Candidatus Aenigmarchaeota archaeon]|nr:hypothetical protein [Candidatus Aenigmarchaeota archaeon]
MKLNKKRKGMDAHVLGLALGVVVLLVVLGVIVGLNTTGAFKDFLNKVPWLNKIIPEDSKDNPNPIDQIGVCGGLCENKARNCPQKQRCKATADPDDDPGLGECTADVVCDALGPNPAGNVLRLYAVPDSPGDVYYVIYEDAAATYSIRPGDCLEYDIWISSDASGIGGIDIKTQPGGKQWWNEDKWKDINGQKASMRKSKDIHSDNEDISDYAYRTWHRRKIPVFEDPDPDKTMVGKGVELVRLVFEQDKLSKAPIIAYFDNVRFVNCKNAADVGKIIYEDALLKSPADLDRSGGYENERLELVNIAGLTSVPDYRVHGTDALKFVAINPDGKNNIFWKTGSPVPLNNYIFIAGDTVEYDVCVVSSAKEIGGIDILDDSGKRWKDIATDCDRVSGAVKGNGNKWRDQNLISGHPKCMETQKFGENLVLNKWYHRVMIVPEDRLDKKITNFMLASELNDKGTYTVYYDNIFITNGDKLKTTIYQDGPPGLNEKFEGDGSYSAVLTSVSPPDATICAPADAALNSFVKD